jgi:hypothetical protein
MKLYRNVPLEVLNQNCPNGSIKEMFLGWSFTIIAQTVPFLRTRWRPELKVEKLKTTSPIKPKGVF